MKRIRRARKLLALLSTSWALVGAGACVTAPPTIDGLLTVDKAQYSIAVPGTGYGFKLVYTFVNRSSTTLYIQRDCTNNIDWIMWRAGPDSISAGYNERDCPIAGPQPAIAIAIAPGETRSDTLFIHAFNDFVYKTLSDYTGTFQLVLRITVSPGGSNVAPSAVRRSQPFVVVAN